MNSPQETRRKNALTAIFAVIALIYVFPVILVVINSFKASAYVTSETFRLPTEEPPGPMSPGAPGWTTPPRRISRSALPRSARRSGRAPHARA